MILLLHGLSRSGKDTVAHRLTSNFDFHHLKISAHLKRCASLLFGVPEDHFENHNKDLPNVKWGRTPREILKFLGTDVFQFQIENLVPGTNRCFWIDHLHDDVARLQMMKKDVVISDYRFPHELSSLRKKFPDETIRVIRVIPAYQGYTLPTKIDESETLLPYDFSIDNGTTIDDLHERVDLLVKELTQTRSQRNR